ncbi:FKBP-type peptidyl-prolyl cis-trans isomerase [Guillardia theta CCMP2712]|uniref:peptidylprolyl isomerase n=1 Tax=Guillardia theta (strain CCMP2712) TaxID=905079 RepID=L1JEL6_GUITC|nr:FKBP-type peptidyl-prolyl cis-trans isomerase [Guillardia theta CCMP2712]EKX46579.1 FKBP-type peptidyl-prolyl cis-trans isomerase [Guillardia theta CCMP2712]|eukprot:XP_005833559.1 FKBP-type peptidyl-prolyl cis-trans isomerase [Guillardia theta CCMP2712]
MGITVESIQAGDGKHYPSKRQTVTLHYVGYLDRAGEHKFDSTWDRGPIDPKTKKPAGRPFKFRIHSGQVVKGWDEGVSQLSLGEKARITMTADYAYGERGIPGLIPPNATLYLEVTLIAIH